MNREQVVMVTGVSSGIGRATAELPAREGNRVYGTLRKEAGGDGSLADVELVRLDVRDAESLDHGVRQFGIRVCPETCLGEARTLSRDFRGKSRSLL